MISGNFRKFAALAPVLTLAVTGCFGGGGNTPTAATTYVVDRNSYTGTGYQADPYVMPSEMPANTTGGTADYFASAAGYWQVTLSSKYVETGGNTATPPPISSTVVYDSVADSWTVNIGGADYLLTWNAAPTDQNYFCDVAGGTCTLPADTNIGLANSFSTITKYGQFAAVWYELDNVTDSSGAVLLAHTGLRTPVGDMPNSGSATYEGDAFAFLDRGAKKQSVQGEGTVTVTANFGSSTNTVDLTGSLTMDATGVAEGGETMYGTAAIATMTGSGNITGNEFTGTITTDLTNMAGASDTTLNGTMAGAFYGPAADEVVGYFDASGAVVSTITLPSENVIFMGGFATVVTP
jgi:hypothetical protein